MGKIELQLDGWARLPASLLSALFIIACANAIIIPENTGWNFNAQEADVGAGAAIYPSSAAAWQDDGNWGVNINVTQSTFRKYNTWGEPMNVTDARGYSASTHYSPCGPYEISNHLYVAKRIVYDEGCRPIEMYDENGQMTRIWYDTLGRVERVAGPSDSYEQPAMRKIYHFGSPLNNENFVSTFGKLDGETYVEQRSLYDGLGRGYRSQEISEADGSIERQTQYYRFIGLPNGTSDAFYPEQGINNNAWTTFSYTNDPLRVRTVTNPPGAGAISTSYAVVDNAMRTTTTDENGIATQDFSDAYGRHVKTIDAAGETWQYQYDGLGHLVSATPPDGGAVHTYQFDSLGRFWREHDPEKDVFNGPQYDNTDAYEYDESGNLVWHYTALGFKTLRYDALNRLTLVKYNDYASGNGEVPVIAYFYDGDDSLDNRCLNGNGYAIGKLCAVKRLVTDMPASQQPRTEESSRRFGYDENGRVVEEQVRVRRPDTTYAQHTIQYTYTEGGKIDTETIDAKVRYTFYYDTFGRLYALNLQRTNINHEFGPMQSIIMLITYKADGATEQIMYGNGVQAEYQYTLRGWVENINAHIWETEIFQRNYAYDNTGSLHQMRDEAGGQLLATYNYDSLYRLASVDDSGYYGQDYSFTYDALGNRLTQTVGAATSIYNYDITQNNKLISVTPGGQEPEMAFTYNAHGALSSKQATGSQDIIYSYNNYDNMLKSVDTNNDGRLDMRFTYDEKDRRVTKLGSSGWSAYLYDAFGNNVLVEETHWGS